MGAITISKYKKGDIEYRKYTHTLPKEQMDNMKIQKGDKLIYVGETAGILSFQLQRGKN